MKPQGRKCTKHNSKWKLKENGKHIAGWWENTIEPSKTREKREAEAEINNGINAR